MPEVCASTGAFEGGWPPPELKRRQVGAKGTSRRRKRTPGRFEQAVDNWIAEKKNSYYSN